MPSDVPKNHDPYFVREIHRKSLGEILSVALLSPACFIFFASPKQHTKQFVTIMASRPQLNKRYVTKYKNFDMSAKRISHWPPGFMLVH